MIEEDGHTGALRCLKMAADQPENARSLIDEIRDAAVKPGKYTDDFLSTIAACAIQGWKDL